MDWKVKSHIETARKQLTLFQRLRDLKAVEILIGIPEDRTGRDGDKEMNNATLLAIHSKGSPLRNLPPRPLIEPALSADDNVKKLSEDLKVIAQRALADDISGAIRFQNITGQDAVNMVKNWFDDPRNGWPQNQPATVIAKLRKLRSDKKRKALLAKYNAGDTGVDQVLVDTGQLRNAITYVLRKKK